MVPSARFGDSDGGWERHTRGMSRSAKPFLVCHTGNMAGDEDVSTGTGTTRGNDEAHATFPYPAVLGNGNGTAGASPRERVPAVPGNGNVIRGSVPAASVVGYRSSNGAVPGRERRPGTYPVPVPTHRRERPAKAAGKAAKTSLRDRVRGRAREHDALLWLVIWAITGVSTWMAASGQLGVWEWAGENPDDTRRFGVPFLMEIGVVAWLLIGKHAINNTRSPFPWWGMALAFSGMAVYTNVVHGTWKQALIFGTASALSLALWFAKFLIDFIGIEVDNGLRAGARPKVLLTGLTIEQPRIRWRAHLIAGQITKRRDVDADGNPTWRPLTLDDVIELAVRWIEVRDDTLAYERRPAFGQKWLWTVGDRKVAKRTAWHVVREECGQKVMQDKALHVRRVTFAAPELEPAPVVGSLDAHPVLPAATPARRQAPAARTRQVVTRPDSDEEPVPEEWFTRHAARILTVQRVHEHWVDNPSLTAVRKIKALSKEHPEVAMGNSKVLKEVAACIRELRRQALADRARSTG
jgi:hypothetical protein